MTSQKPDPLMHASRGRIDAKFGMQGLQLAMPDSGTGFAGLMPQQHMGMATGSMTLSMGWSRYAQAGLLRPLR